MRMKTSLVVSVALATLASGTGCKKKGGESGGGPAEAAPWMPKDAAKLWDGAWFTRMHLQSNKKSYTSLAGDPVALEIKGSTATAWGGEKDQELGFAIEAPCAAKFSEPITEGSMKGGTSYNTMLFVVDNGKLVVGSGAGGYRKGKTAIVCKEGMGGGITIVDDKGCNTWESHFDRWEKKADTCVWSQADGADVLTIGTGQFNTVVTAQGDVLMSDQFKEWAKGNYHVKAKDFADAKAQVTAKIKADDPGEQAKALGGVAGKTDTVLSLTASLAADPSLKGKPVELTALYMNESSSTSNGETTYNITLIESKESSQIYFACDLGKTKPPEGLVQYDKVTVKGTIGEAFGKPEIEGCTVAKSP